MVKGGLSARQIRRVTAIIAARLGEEISLAHLAAACELSVRHFTRAFAQSFGLPAHRYLMQQRVRHAQYLLAHSGQAIAAIALQCGFVDQSHLTRVFSRMVGCSPAQWRRLKAR